jgi:hypothetical protein
MKPSRIHKGEYSNAHSKKDTGGLALTDKSMKPPVKVPCVECPLRRDSAKGYLGGYSPEMYLDILHSPASIACHSSKGFHTREIEKQSFCTGVAAYRANVGHIASVQLENGFRIPTEAHNATKIIGSDPETFFATPEEFFWHHHGHQVKKV